MGMSGALLRPKTSGHPEALAWRSAVIANGGTVSASTMTAVTTFCRSIDSAGLRDRFYRLNLFCGTGLEAVLVPLYRGPSRTGTQYGNTTDTNGNFVLADYAENNGLVGNGSTKYLNTGFDANAAGLTTTSTHMAATWPTYSHPASAAYYALAVINAAVNDRFWLLQNSFAGNTRVDSNLGQSAPAANYQVSANNGATINGGLWTASRTSQTDFRLYEQSTERALQSFNVGDFALPSNAMTVFVRWNGSAFFGYSAIRLRSYSVGLGMTAQQVADYNAVMITFQAALGRT
jgi:hypothetical protein